MAAYSLGVPLDRIDVTETSTSVIPNQPPTTMSSTDLCGDAICMAVREIRDVLDRSENYAQHLMIMPTLVVVVSGCSRLIQSMAYFVCHISVVLDRYGDERATFDDKVAAALAAGEDLSARGMKDGPKLWFVFRSYRSFLL